MHSTSMAPAGTGQVQAGAAAVVLTPHTNTNSLGVVSAGDPTVAQSDLNAIHTTDFVALGSQNEGFVGNTTIGQGRPGRWRWQEPCVPPCAHRASHPDDDHRHVWRDHDQGRDH
jgi:hypothetical protein